MLKRRLELGMTQEKLVEAVKQQGDEITQATISKIESGHRGIKNDTYDKVFRALGGLESLNVQFGPSQNKRHYLAYL